MKNIEINITTGTLKLVIQKKFISLTVLKISKFSTRRAKYISAGTNNRSLIGEKL